MHGNFTGITDNVNSEISKAKEKLLADTTVKTDITEEVEDIVGPIKRQK